MGMYIYRDGDGKGKEQHNWKKAYQLKQREGVEEPKDETIRV